MVRWAPYTFVRILFFLVAGIVAGIFCPDILSIHAAWIIIFALVCAYAIFFVLWHFVYFYRFNPGTIGLAGIFLSGYVLTVYHKESRNPDHLINVSDSIQYFKAVVTGYPEEKQKAWKLEASVSRVYTKEWRSVEGKVILYFSKADFSKPFQYGDEILVRGSPRLVSGPSNPGEFDYRRYLSFRNIYHQHFIREGEVSFLENNPPSTAMALSMRARMWADRQLKNVVIGDREQGIASALVLGITDGIDNELLGAYSATGAMHVLAVSGLHISIIYLLILWLCKPILKYKFGPWALAVISLFLLWGYAFLTGLSPSVLRAVTMFSFVAIAKPARQFTNIYNILAVSAFFLLVFDPFLIMSVGFQLSYVAVLGILYLQPGLYQIWNSKNYLLDQTWKVTTVAIAAQVATLPLGLLYFHQFPNYFLITNMLVVPISFVVLVVGIAAIIFGFVPILISVLGWILTWSIKLMNGVIFFTDSLPFAITDNIHITLFQCWMLITMIICVTIFLERKKFLWFGYTALFVILFSGAGWFHHYHQVRHSQLLVYNVNGFNAIDLMKNGHASFMADSLIKYGDEKISFHIKPARLIFGIKKIESPDSVIRKKFDWGSVVFWENKTLMHVSRGAKLPQTIQTDYVIISFNSVRNLSALSFLSKPPRIILDGTNSYFYSERTMKEAAALGLAVHSVKHHGAYQEVINNSI
jgi:competence protein ComEC